MKKIWGVSEEERILSQLGIEQFAVAVVVVVVVDSMRLLSSTQRPGCSRH